MNNIADERKLTRSEKNRRLRAIAVLAAGQLFAVCAMAAVISIADDDAAPEQPEDARALVTTP